jgi:hypothetical protein
VVQECQLTKRAMFPDTRSHQSQRPVSRTQSNLTFGNPLEKHAHGSPVQKSRSFDVLKNPFRRNNNENNNNTSTLDHTHVLRNSMDFCKIRRVKPANLDTYKMATKPPTPPSSYDSDAEEIDLNESSESGESIDETKNNEENATNDNETNDTETKDNDITNDDNENNNEITYTETDESIATNLSNESFDAPDNPPLDANAT